MKMAMDLREGDILELKKQHPCGGTEFEVMRSGMDFRIRCMKCETQVWISRVKLEKRIKKVKNR